MNHAESKPSAAAGRGRTRSPPPSPQPQAVMAATIEQIAALGGFGKKTAQTIRDTLHAPYQLLVRCAAISVLGNCFPGGSIVTWPSSQSGPPSGICYDCHVSHSGYRILRNQYAIRHLRVSVHEIKPASFSYQR